MPQLWKVKKNGVGGIVYTFHPGQEGTVSMQIAFLQEEGRWVDASDLASQQDIPDKKWADDAIGAHLRADQCERADALLEWSKTQPEPVHKACVLAFARTLGLFDATMIGVGAMIGARIFVPVGMMKRQMHDDSPRSPRAIETRSHGPVGGATPSHAVNPLFKPFSGVIRSMKWLRYATSINS